ncbi:RES family NAD+ phosphorylase [Sphingomonas bacterium]|uniref:RES family NAD+ phosphorylase n=1 Tax=Sphingomonas bacterium TaxID=1895847 RepID=UPI001C2DABAD|nr:RES domain-containing protein [Sphingomonas bacterium]
MGRAWRGHDPSWAFAPLSGEGARLTGGRFNRRGVPALYLALDLSTAIAECSQGFGRRLPPLTLCEYDVDCDDLADLTSEADRAAHGISLDDLTGGWRLELARSETPASWQAVDALIAAGFAGVIVPSFAVAAPQGGRNLVLWRWADDAHKVTVYDPGARLPRDRRSWPRR